MSVDALVPEVRGGLAVSPSYDDEKIPALIRRTVTRLLRDYHFPQSVRRLTLTLLEGDQQITLPAGFKKELEVRLYDPTSKAWTDPLRKRSGFQLPYPSKTPRYYWLEGNSLLMDTPATASMAGFELTVWAETMDAASNEDWLTETFPDAVMYASIVRGCAEFRKPDIMQTYGVLWTDEQASLAIYTNELEWGGAEMIIREAHIVNPDRYPIC